MTTENTKAATDDVTDDVKADGTVIEGGDAIRAAANKAKKEAEAAKLAKNAEMKDRIKNTRSGGRRHHGRRAGDGGWHGH